MTLVDRVAQWPELWRREGYAEARRQGRARERALLRQIAAVRFGDETGDQLGFELAGNDDADLLEAVEELIVSAESGPALVDAVTELVRRSA